MSAQHNKLTIGIVITLATLLVSITTYAVITNSNTMLCLQEVAELKENEKIQDNKINQIDIINTQVLERLTVIQADIVEIKKDIKEIR